MRWLVVVAAAGMIALSLLGVVVGLVGLAIKLAVSGGIGPYVWSLGSGSLPAGVALSPSTGAVSGTPTPD